MSKRKRKEKGAKQGEKKTRQGEHNEAPVRKLGTLPPEVQLYIFTFLKVDGALAVESTCKQFRDLLKV